MSQTRQTQEPAPEREDPPESAGRPDQQGGKPAKDRRANDERLDEGLEETFPSSDPVSVKITK